MTESTKGRSREELDEIVRANVAEALADCFELVELDFKHPERLPCERCNEARNAADSPKRWMKMLSSAGSTAEYQCEHCGTTIMRMICGAGDEAETSAEGRP
jgi:hypothetical protein